MKSTRLTRRDFSKMLVGGFVGAGLVEAAIQESRAAGRLSANTVATLLDHIGYPAAADEEMAQLGPLIEETIRALQVIRDFEVPMTLEPSFVFHADK